MSIPTTRSEFSDFCMRKLGWPVIEINLDLDQIDDRIDEALDFYRQFNFDATQLFYFKYQLTQPDITNGYIPVDASINGITKIFSLGAGLYSNNMFSFNYQFALNDLPFLTGGSLQYYAGTMQYLETIEMLLVGQKPIRFNRHTNKLYIDMDWGTVTPGEWVIAESHQILDETNYPQIWSDRMLQRYATSLLKKQWGENLSKFSGIQLPGGITLNGQAIKEEAVIELEKLEEEFQLTYQLPGGMFVG